MKGRTLNGLLAGILLLLAGCSGPVQYHATPSRAVGTAWGEEVHSSVTGVAAKRAERDPADVILIHYAAEPYSGHDGVYSIRAGELEYAIRDANFNALPITRRYNASTGGWQYNVPARVGSRYQLYVRNYSRDVRYEIVATVDGLDVLSGRPGSLNNSGYIVDPGASLAIKGFRKDKNTEAAFEFSAVEDAYAANSAYGDARHVGIVGFAAFRLLGPATKALPPCSAQAFPADSGGYAPPPCRR
ncbi:hypothetical protein [Intestinirhabdus alba]|jgi:hypothetical protein|uniref:Lipoprotein n=1 Tax=Intestinirhabdus alba TaxID=2899544 RepID=A0A6L6IMM3_9ENTR|nr:hypothetical protein [Intestinirhabdus alba]MTH48121.1 hypothetical protein [Intestinirhabdus alba]